MNIPDQIRDILYFHPIQKKAIVVIGIFVVCYVFILFNRMGKETASSSEFCTIEDLLFELEDGLGSTVGNERPAIPKSERSIPYSRGEKEISLPAENKMEPQSLFEFDPNTIKADSLKILGLNPYAIKNLIKYRNAGGRFRQFADLERIYAMDSLELNPLRPYARFPRCPKKERKAA